jgi:hypothetical protein
MPRRKARAPKSAAQIAASKRNLAKARAARSKGAASAKASSSKLAVDPRTPAQKAASDHQALRNKLATEGIIVNAPLTDRNQSGKVRLLPGDPGWSKARDAALSKAHPRLVPRKPNVAKSVPPVNVKPNVHKNMSAKEIRITDVMLGRKATTAVSPIHPDRRTPKEKAYDIQANARMAAFQKKHNVSGSIRAKGNF